MAPGSTIYTDGLKSFAGFEQAGFRHIPRTQPLQSDLGKGQKSVAPLADLAIGNLTTMLIGTYHGVSRDQLQVYLDEFVFRHNRRQPPMAGSRLCSASAPRLDLYLAYKNAEPQTFTTPERLKHYASGLAETTR